MTVPPEGSFLCERPDPEVPRRWTVHVVVATALDAVGPEEAAAEASAAIRARVGSGVEFTTVEHVLAYEVTETDPLPAEAVRARFEVDAPGAEKLSSEDKRRYLEAAAGLDPECRLCRTQPLPAYTHPLCTRHG